MALESGSYIADLIITNPTPGDPKSQGDDHLRLIKDVVRNCFAGFEGPVLIGGTSTGTANAYVLTPDEPVPGLVTNMLVAWKPNAPSTGPSTITISGLPATDILAADGTALMLNDLNQYVLMVYDGTSFRLLGVTKNYVDSLAFSSALPAQPGVPTRYLLGSQNGVATFDVPRVPVQARSAGAMLLLTDSGNLIEYSAGNFVQRFPLPAVVGNGWNVLLKNNTLQDIEIEAPIVNNQASTTSNSIAAGTTWTIATGLTVAVGDLVVTRRTADPFNKRIVATVTSYDPASGILVLAPVYRIGSGATAAQPVTSQTQSGTTATVTTALPHGLFTGETVTVTGTVPADYNGTFPITVPPAPASQIIASIAHSGTTATVTTAAAHGLPAGAVVTISGATPDGYNGTYPITSTGPTSFTYTMAADPGANATVVGAYVVLVNTFTYTMLTSPGVNASTLGAYAPSANYTDWTITTRPPAMAADGLASYVMYPGETRLFNTNGTTLNSIVVKGYRFRRSISQTIVKMPGYGAHVVRLIGGGSGAPGGGGGANGVSGTAAGGGGAGGTSGQNGTVLEKILNASDLPVAPLFICGSGSAGSVGGVGGVVSVTTAAPSAATGNGGASSLGQATDITYLQALGGNAVNGSGAGLTNGTGGGPGAPAPAVSGTLPFNGVIVFDRQSANTGISGATSAGGPGGSGGNGGTGKAAISSLAFPVNGVGGAGTSGAGGAGTAATGTAAVGQGGAGGGGGGGGASTGSSAGGAGGAGSAGGAGQLEMYGMA